MMSRRAATSQDSDLHEDGGGVAHRGVAGRGAGSVKAVAASHLQRFVDVGPDGSVALIRSRLRVLRSRGQLRRDDGSGIVSEHWFAQFYADSADPWDYTTSAYERRKYALTLAALPHDRYR